MTTLASLLAAAFEVLLRPIDQLLSAIPLGTARVFVLLLLLVPLALVVRQKREWIFAGAPDRALWRDLRLWAVLILVPYLLLYALAP